MLKRDTKAMEIISTPQIGLSKPNIKLDQISFSSKQSPTQAIGHQAMKGIHDLKSTA
jgi:hypothetical protein